MSERKHSKKQQAYAGCPLEGAQPNSPSAESRQVNQNLEDRIKQIQAEKIQLEEQCRQMETHNKQLEERHNGFVKNQQVLQVKLNEALHRNAEMVHENKQLDTKYRELEARNKDLEEIHKEMLVNQQKQPNVDNINEGWGIMFNQAKQRIASLMTEKKQNRHELRTMSCQLQQAQAVNLEIYGNLQDAVNLKQQLQVQLDEALEENQELLQEKKQQDIKEKEMECKLHNMKKQNDVLQVKINEALQRNAQVLHEKKQLDTEYRELEGRNKDLEERHKEMLVNQQKQPNVDNINEGWGIMFNQAKQRIASLMTEKKQNRHELRTMSCQLQQAQAVSLEIYGKLQDAVNLKQQLQVQLDEALEKNQELLQEKEQLEKIQEKKNTRTIRRTGERRDPPASSLDHEAA